MVSAQPARPPADGQVPADLLDRVRTRHVRTISRCITAIENGDPAAAALLHALREATGRALVVGVTGVPGAGKSTLVPTLAREWTRRGRPAAILAVDPSSSLSGGAILGDRIRDADSGDGKVYFRSLGSRGGASGLARALPDIVDLLDAAGFGAILVETVGTGQSEIAVTGLVHTTLLLTAPGLGDEVQAMKAGILELADLVVVNKADADPAGARTAALTLRQALAEAMRAHGRVEGVNRDGDGRPDFWHPPVRAVSALRRDGVDELLELVEQHRSFLEATGRTAGLRGRRALERFEEALREALVGALAQRHGAALEALRRGVERGTLCPRGAAGEAARMLATDGTKQL